MSDNDFLSSNDFDSNQSDENLGCETDEGSDDESKLAGDQNAEKLDNAFKVLHRDMILKDMSENIKEINTVMKIEPTT